MQLVPSPPPVPRWGYEFECTSAYVRELAIFKKEIKEIYITKEKEVKRIIIRMDKYINK